MGDRVSGFVRLALHIVAQSELIYWVDAGSLPTCAPSDSRRWQGTLPSPRRLLPYLRSDATTPRIEAAPGFREVITRGAGADGERHPYWRRIFPLNPASTNRNQCAATIQDPEYLSARVTSSPSAVMLRVRGGGDRGYIGAGLCRIRYTDFRERFVGEPPRTSLPDARSTIVSAFMLQPCVGRGASQRRREP
jgi:hypothetical protein